MSYLLDIDVICELARTRPDGRVVEWFRRTPDGLLFLSVLTLGEIRRGVERLTDTPRKEKLRIWLERDLPLRFEERLCPVTAGVADRWGRLVAETGRPVPAVDSLLAATALHHDLRLVTRNERDYAYPGLVVVNPWSVIPDVRT